MMEEINIRQIKNGFLIYEGREKPWYVKDKVEIIGVISAMMLKDTVSGDDLEEKLYIQESQSTPADSG